MSGYDFVVGGGNRVKVARGSFTVTTENTIQALDVTDRVIDFISEVKIKDGVVLCFNRHSTAPVIICNKREDVVNDVLAILCKLVSGDLIRELNIKRESNAMRAYFGASIFGASLCLPLTDSRLAIGEWQAVYLLELNGPREREISLLAIGSE